MLANFLRADGLFVHANGSIFTVEQWAADLASGAFRYDAIDVLQLVVTRSGDCVVLVFAQRSRIVLQGEVHRSSTRAIVVWAPFDDDKCLIACQTTHVAG